MIQSIGLTLFILCLIELTQCGEGPECSDPDDVIWAYIFESELEGGVPPFNTSCSANQSPNYGAAVWYVCSSEDIVEIHVYNFALGVGAHLSPLFACFELLKTLKIQGSGLTGSVPLNFGGTQLATVDLSRNSLTGAWPTFSSASDMQALSLYGNSFAGTLPLSWGSWSSLKFLEIGYGEASGEANSVTGGTIPSALLTAWSSLVVFTASHVGLVGTIPTQFYAIGILGVLRLDGNELTGTVSTAIGALSLLYNLALDRNKLTGALPTELNDTFLSLYNVLVEESDLFDCKLRDLTVGGGNYFTCASVSSYGSATASLCDIAEICSAAYVPGSDDDDGDGNMSSTSTTSITTTIGTGGDGDGVGTDAAALAAADAARTEFNAAFSVLFILAFALIIIGAPPALYALLRIYERRIRASEALAESAPQEEEAEENDGE